MNLDRLRGGYQSSMRNIRGATQQVYTQKFTPWVFEAGWVLHRLSYMSMKMHTCDFVIFYTDIRGHTRNPARINTALSHYNNYNPHDSLKTKMENSRKFHNSAKLSQNKWEGVGSGSYIIYEPKLGFERLGRFHDEEIGSRLSTFGHQHHNLTFAGHDAYWVRKHAQVSDKQRKERWIFRRLVWR